MLTSCHSVSTPDSSGRDRSASFPSRAPDQLFSLWLRSVSPVAATLCVCSGPESRGRFLPQVQGRCHPLVHAWDTCPRGMPPFSLQPSVLLSTFPEQAMKSLRRTCCVSHHAVSYGRWYCCARRGARFGDVVDIRCSTIGPQGPRLGLDCRAFALPQCGCGFFHGLFAWATSVGILHTASRNPFDCRQPLPTKTQSNKRQALHRKQVFATHRSCPVVIRDR